MKRILALTITAAAALVLTSTALANSLTCGHGGTCYASAAVGRHNGGGTLPLTGLNLATVAAIAVFLIASGLTLRWATRHRS
jgi:hypothetical protein